MPRRTCRGSSTPARTALQASIIARVVDEIGVCPDATDAADRAFADPDRDIDGVGVVGDRPDRRCRESHRPRLVCFVSMNPPDQMTLPASAAVPYTSGIGAPTVDCWKLSSLRRGPSRSSGGKRMSPKMPPTSAPAGPKKAAPAMVRTEPGLAIAHARQRPRRRLEAGLPHAPEAVLDHADVRGTLIGMDEGVGVGVDRDVREGAPPLSAMRQPGTARGEGGAVPEEVLLEVVLVREARDSRVAVQNRQAGRPASAGSRSGGRRSRCPCGCALVAGTARRPTCGPRDTTWAAVVTVGRAGGWLGREEGAGQRFAKELRRSIDDRAAGFHAAWHGMALPLAHLQDFDLARHEDRRGRGS